MLTANQPVMDMLTALNELLAKICKLPPMIPPGGVYNLLGTSSKGEDDGISSGPDTVSLGQCNFGGIIVACNAGIYELNRRMAEGHSREQASHGRRRQCRINDPEGWRCQIISKQMGRCIRVGTSCRKHSDSALRITGFKQRCIRIM